MLKNNPTPQLRPAASDSQSVAISQSNYLPWIGYFDLIASVDHFVLYDCCQYTRRDWRNRNRVLSSSGEPLWLTVPVLTKNSYHASISSIQVDSSVAWASQHLKTLRGTYSKSPFFDEVMAVLAPLQNPPSTLSTLNGLLIRSICAYLGIYTTIHTLSDGADLPLERSERLATITTRLGCDTYISSPKALVYLESSAFLSRGIQPFIFQFGTHPNHSSKFNLSVVDLLFRHGRATKFFLNRGTLERPHSLYTHND
jgi:WbqC-like protein family